MSKHGGVPDAWDDDWEKAAEKSEPQPVAAPKLTKSQRRTQHLEQQRQLWDSAENNTDRYQWLEAKGVVPLKQEFKPQVTLLSRKPVIARREPGAGTEGIGSLNLGDDDSDDEASRKQRQADLEERQRKAKLEREEKQRRYAEARERIMGSGAAAATVSNSRDSSHGRDGRKSRGKLNSNNNNNRTSQPTSADQSPARSIASGDRQLFDPDDMGRRLPKRESLVTPREIHPMRQPRGPEQSGRGGFGFAIRGGRPIA